MNTNQDTALTNQDVMIDIKPLKQADIVQIIRTAESLDDAVNKMNGLAANGWLTLWDNATHPDGTSYRDLPAWKEATKASVELVDELKAATKASEKRIQELEAEVMKAQSYFMKSQRELRELQSHVNQLREALVILESKSNLPHVARCALSSTPSQSLIEHDNEVIERCAMVADEQMNEHGGQDYYIVGCSDAADSIRKLKVTL